MTICISKTGPGGSRCSKRAIAGSNLCSIHLKQNGGSKFRDYILPEKPYMLVKDDEIILSKGEVSSLNYAGKTVGLMSGCFCPPHKGHFQAIYDACHKYNIDILFLRTQNSPNKDRSRHGLPLSVSLTLLCIYAKYIYSKLGTEIIISPEDIPWNINSSMDKLLMIDVIEVDGEPKEEHIKAAKDIQKINALEGTTRNFLINFDKVNNNKVFKVVLFRNKETGISATSFVKSMKRLLVDSASFLPDGLSESEKYGLIADMITEFGTDLR